MADIACARCGEPWDAAEVFECFEADEKRIFLAGDGCPHCVSKPMPANFAQSRTDWAESLLEATDDPDALLRRILDRLDEV